jgi:hypothetical protein
VLLLLSANAPVNTIAFTTDASTVSATGTAGLPQEPYRPRREYIWTYGIDAVKTGVVS